MIVLALLLGCGGGDRSATVEELPPLEAWAGSAACASCHPSQSAEWTGSWHARTVRPIAPDEQDELASLLSCADMTSTAVLGGRHELRFLIEQPETAWGAGRWLSIPCGRNREGEPTIHHPDTWRDLPWERQCAACHTTGFRGPDTAFLEPGVGCESCHGPGVAHTRSADRADIVRVPEEPAAVCASCHLQGARSIRTGLHIPDRYVPGRPLFDDWRFDFDALDPEGSPVDVHQKLMVRDRLAGATDLQCTSCHSVHSMTHARHSEVPRSELCNACHNPDLTLKEYEQSCDVCEF